MIRKWMVAWCLMISSGIANAQVDTVIAPPYKRFPSVPPFRLLKTDSLTLFTKADLVKNKATLFMLFSPECDHCRHETEEILKRATDFKKIQIVMATMMPVTRMKEFYEKYELHRFSNITVGKDMDNLLPAYFAIHNLPFLAFYNKKGRLIDVFEGALPVEKLLAKFE